MSARDVIAEEIEPAVGVYAPELADAIIARLEASGRSIVHKDEIHAPSVERAIAANEKARETVIYSGQAAFVSGVREGHDRVAAALRELMKEAG